MVQGIVHHEHLARIAMAIALTALGVACLVWPDCMTGIAGYFRLSARRMTALERDRLRRILAARETAEGVPKSYGRFLGVVTIALAGLEFVNGIPYVAPYALACLGFGVLSLLAYVRFHRATQRRTAPLVRRSPFAALPPVLIAALAWVFGLTLALAFYPPARLSALVVIAAELILSVVAWRIAVAPALLVGDDPQWEYAVDERVRMGRARGSAALAFAAPMVLIGFVAPSLPYSYRIYGDCAWLTLAVMFLVTVIYNANVLRQRLSVT
jgi:hypothetical protein